MSVCQWNQSTHQSFLFQNTSAKWSEKKTMMGENWKPHPAHIYGTMQWIYIYIYIIYIYLIYLSFFNIQIYSASSCQLLPGAQTMHLRHAWDTENINNGNQWNKKNWDCEIFFQSWGHLSTDTHSKLHLTQPGSTYRITIFDIYNEPIV